ncbi:insulinase family protein [Desulfovibrio sp. An276]|uniref:insulinase family protein n=1 Tax=Desulfovibrio sp. An276 TaxID=1965618 RepID=UPI0026A08DAD
MNTEFTLVEERSMAEVNGTARFYRHNATGAQIVSVTNDDENKVFGVTFRTPPKNSTGVAHILEHSVLCGSKKYPTKEPFLVLLQSSLQSFLNAFTFPDKTCYPVASANLQDFYNLIDVYIDAVFHPIISENIFRQEGWHLEAETSDGPWLYKGVVYNEMKGVYSSPDSRLSEESQHAIFPDTLYSLDSGGRPDEIPSLSYEEFRDFHSRYYHPSNSRFFFWGDDPEEERLAIVARALAGKGHCDVDSSISLQPAFAAPTRVTRAYPAEKGAKCLFTVNWLTGKRGDLERTLTLEMLQHILEGMPGSPLRRALISSGLGEDTTGDGLQMDLAQTSYSTGLKGVAEEDLPRAEELIFSTLKELAEKGIDKSLVEAAVNTVEFSYRESNTGNFPQGLAAMLQCLATWLYDENPLDSLAWEKPLASIKERLAKGDPVFEEAIRTLFLENPSRATVVLTPDEGLAARIEEEEAARVSAAQAAMSLKEREEVVRITRELQKAQATPDTPEALASIPSLGLGDLPSHNRLTQRAIQETSDFTMVGHELPTRGVAYMNLLIPLPKLPVRLVPSLSLFLRTFRDVGTARRDYTELGALIAAKTGGLGASLTMVNHTDGNLRCYLNLTGKAVSSKVQDLFDILNEILLEPIKDKDVLSQRLKEMLLEDKAGLEQDLVASGHKAASTRVLTHFSPAAVIGEAMDGIHYLNTLRSRLDNWDTALPQLLEDLDELRRLLVVARPGVVHCVGSTDDMENVARLAEHVWHALPGGARVDGTQCISLAAPVGAEVFATPSQVNYVAKGCNLKALGYSYHGSAAVIMRHLARSYLWEQVRVLGGAYGAFCSLDRTSGNFVCSSYRDPNVEKTVAVYDSMADYLAGISLTRGDLTRAIVGTIGDLDLYRLPEARGAYSLGRWLAGESDEALQALREEILSTTNDDFRAFAPILKEAASKGETCVIGGANAARAAEEKGWRCTQLL